ncbi:MAG TPA: CsbD family protein [Polyangia bacterium]|jgi:uncharacterized protein YjbJ (UPF0337 family)|nr:CsbD family protein [Polyangia bacterium]
MNKDQIKGKAENLKGRAKEAAGSLTGDKETQAEGTVERIKGAVREKVGQVKEEITRKTQPSSSSASSYDDEEDIDE